MKTEPIQTTLADDTIVVLDIDDTLYLEESYVRSGFHAVGRHLETSTGVHGVGDTLWSNFVSGVRGDAFDRALPVHGIKPEGDLIATLVEVYRNHRPSIELAPDAERFLRWLHGRPAAAITDGPLESQKHKAKALGLSRFLEPVVYTAGLGPGLSKPHHRAFQLVEETFGTKRGRLLYVGDNPTKDFQAPQERGWDVARIRRPRSLHFDDPSSPGTAEIASLDQLIRQPDKGPS